MINEHRGRRCPFCPWWRRKLPFAVLSVQSRYPAPTTAHPREKMDPTLNVSPHPLRSTGRKLPREPPPSYEVATNNVYANEEDIAQEDTPLLLAPTSHSPPPSPRYARRPARMRREDSQTESLLEALGNHPSTSPVPRVDSVSSYFAPLVRKDYWKPALHLTIINFPFAL